MSVEDEARLREEGDRIEALLAELSLSAGPQTWPRVEELVTRMVSLYGAALERVLRHAREAEPGELDGRLAGDELVSSLLLLHGLHPLGLEERVTRALERARPYLASHGGDVSLIAIEKDGVTLSFTGSCDGCPSSRDTAQGLLRQAIEAEAPEIAHVRIAGALVPLGTKRPRARWTIVPDLERIAHAAKVELEGGAALVLRIGGALLAYAHACPSCGGELEAARLEDGSLACGCGRSYDVAHGGRASDGHAPHLTPLPLLREGGAHRIALEAT